LAGAFPSLFAGAQQDVRTMETQTLLDWLVRKYPLAKRQTLKRMVEAGRVRVNGRRAAILKTALLPKDRVEVSEQVAAQRVAPTRTHLVIVHEDDDILVVDKPAGLLTSTVPREKRATLLAQVRDYLETDEARIQVGLIHRLDRDVSGLLIFSKNDDAYRSLKTQLFHHTVAREYRAVVHGAPKPPKARLETRLVERADGTVHSTKQIGKGEVAISEYEVLKTEGKRSLVRVVILTGRKHQIRVHMAENGTPIVGDKVYGPEGSASRLMLAATRLGIVHPRTGKELTFSLPIPKEFSVRED
jgi:23S rRNA pseudouridine1911/1915/1917 synthase